MRSSPPHDFRLEREHHLTQRAGAFLAVVDLESYPPFIAAKADRLDLLQHLCRQTRTLTAMMWEVPEGSLHLHLLWTDNDQTAQSLQQGGHGRVADGWVRSSGRLCLTGDDRLLALSRRRQAPPGARSKKEALILTPPGIYAVAAFKGTASRAGSEKVRAGYTLVLRHYPHPGPRLLPVRLGALISTAV